jgi:Ca2+-binding EF-hand superfamily protein
MAVSVSFCTSLTSVLHSQEIRELFNHFDTDKSGSLDFDEFLKALRVLCHY